MANYDKYDPITGGSRAKLAAALTLVAGEFGPKAVSLNASGKVVVGTAGQSGLFGILVKNVAKGPVTQYGTDLSGGTPNAFAPIGAQQNDVVDVMQHGDIVGLDPTVFVAGSKVYAATNGDISVGGSASGKFLIGQTVEAGRLVVRIVPGIVAAA